MGVTPPYVARVGSAPNAINRRTISTWSFSTASWIGLQGQVKFSFEMNKNEDIYYLLNSRLAEFIYFRGAY